MKLLFVSLGCDKNLVDSEEMLGLLTGNGFEIVDDETEAEAIVVNTCCFINDAKEESVNTILEMAEYKKTGSCKVLVVTGCMAQRYKNEIIEEVPEVDAVLGTTSYGDILKAIREAMEGKHFQEFKDIDYLPEKLGKRVLTTGGHFGYLKIAEGCDKHCTYCIIPYARGPVRSLSLEQAVEQTRQLAAEGYREIVLTGFEISSWGHDFKNGQSLIDLLEALSAAAPEVRLRLGSLEPRTVTEDFCRRAAALPNLCPQFHLSMQSGCDATLKRMNRKYDTARYLESVELLKRWFDRPAVTTDLITGFPEETEEEFAQTLDFIRKCRFAQMHIFPYSIRPGTPAAKMEQVPKAVKEERARRAAAVAEEMHRSYLEGCVGRTYPVLFEQPKNGKFFGHAPNYMEVLVDGAELHNALKNVRITDVDGEALLGEIVEQEAEA